MNFKAGKHFLQIPGPTNVPLDVLGKNVDEYVRAAAGVRGGR